jgi:transglutaminase-like putative cysteine protease
VRANVKKLNNIEFVLSYNFSVPGNTSKIRYVVLLPKTIPGRQKIFDIKYSPEPSKCFSKNGNDYAEFVFVEPPKQFKVEITVKAGLFKYDLSTARRKTQLNHANDPNLSDFLKNEKYVEKDEPQIQQIVKSMTGRLEINRVRSIYNYVIDNMEYGGYGKKDLGALKAIQRKSGDCSEYSDLFVALCRANNIPARVVTGCTTEFKTTPKHAWCEVYLQQYGWVPFDPLRGDKEDPKVRKNRFYTLENIYVYFTHLRNDEVLNNNRYAVYWHWGDEIEFEDSIEFK